MPTSHMHQLNEIVEVIRLVNPSTLLDVGAGAGKYGVLAREYLELLDGRERYGDWQRVIDGIEAFPGYLTPLHDFVYDHVYVGDAARVLPQLTRHYDLILLVDVLEHFARDDGAALLRACCEKGRYVLVSTPGWFIRQPAAFGNPHEEHRSFWTRADFNGLGPTCFIPNEVSLICLIGSDVPVMRRQMLRGRRWLRASHFLRRSYRAIKRRLTGAAP